jgi:hypothetical protein
MCNFRKKSNINTELKKKILKTAQIMKKQKKNQKILKNK